MRRYVILGILLVNSPSQALDQTDLPSMHKTYEANQARFMRDFKGKDYDAQMKVKAVSENPIFRGQFTVSFGQGIIFGDVSCNLTDKRLIDFATDLNAGDVIRVRGSVDDHVMGSVVLKNCLISRQ